MAKLSARLQSGRRALARLAERKAFDSYVRRGAVPQALHTLKAAAADEQKFLDLCAGLSLKALSEGKPTTHYTWRTAGDDKVRHTHAALAGQVFAWSAPSEVGHPGVAYNCRCWAEPYYGNPALPDAFLTLAPQRLMPSRATDAWARIDTLRRPDGSMARSLLAMRNGTRIQSMFTGQAVSRTVTMPDGSSYSLDRLGDVGRVSVSRPSEPAVQVAWLGRALSPIFPTPVPPPPAVVPTSGSPRQIAPVTQLTPFTVMLHGATALYNALVDQPEAMGLGIADLPIFAIKVWQGLGSDGKVAVSAEALTAEQVAHTCKLMPEVQEWTDSAALALAPIRTTSGPQAWGTAVHSAINQKVIALRSMFPARYANVHSEISISSEGNHSGTEDGSVHYGRRETSRLDILEIVDETIACIYDIKTGKRGLHFGRAEDFVRRVSKIPGVETVVVVQVGITWLHSGK